MGAKKNRNSERGPEEAYSGEWYTPEMSPEEYANYRTREKGYCAIAAVLHLAVGLLPAMGLNAAYVALFYILGLALILYMTISSYRRPQEAVPHTVDQYNRAAKQPKLLTNLQRILVILTLILDVISTYLFGLGISLWLILQLILLLLEALDLQFLFRMQRDLTWEVSTARPRESTIP